MGHRGRGRVRALFVGELLLGPPTRARIAVGNTRIEIGGGPDFPVDWKAFVEIFGDEIYAESYRGSHVLDVRAHKGCFGAYGLATGAARVVSYEPAAANYDALEGAARPLRPPLAHA
ncbi:MAG TPA: hypothetical protein VLA69_00630 [Gaiellaceae bacterium]|nr:hypothetical protein [Gaiellaceae bacterium]